MNVLGKELLKLLENKKNEYDSELAKGVVDSCIKDIETFFDNYLAVTVNSGEEVSMVLSDEIFNNFAEFINKNKDTAQIILDPIIGNDIKLNISRDKEKMIPDIDKKKVMLYLFSKENSMKVSPSDHKIYNATTESIPIKTPKKLIVKTYHRVTDLPKVGDPTIVYSISNTNVLYTWDNSIQKYIPIKQAKPSVNQSKKHTDIYSGEKISDTNQNKQDKYIRKKIISGYLRKKK